MKRMDCAHQVLMMTLVVVTMSTAFLLGYYSAEGKVTEKIVEKKMSYRPVQAYFVNIEKDQVRTISFDFNKLKLILETTPNNPKKGRAIEYFDMQHGVYRDEEIK